MARGVNKVILIGALGADPETRYLQDGKAVTNVRLATSESWTDKQTGNKESRTEWHRVVFFGRLAEIAGEYLKNGSKVYVEGALRTRKWQDQSGQDRYSTEIVANEMQMLNSREASPEPPPHQRQPPHTVNNGFESQQGFGSDQPQQSPHSHTVAGEIIDSALVGEFDDDIPF